LLDVGAGAGHFAAGQRQVGPVRVTVPAWAVRTVRVPVPCRTSGDVDDVVLLEVLANVPVESHDEEAKDDLIGDAGPQELPIPVVPRRAVL